MNNQPLTLALPKGRLEKDVQAHLAARGINFSFENRKLVAQDSQGLLRIMLVKNADLPVYVHHGIAGLGICGDDVLYESGYDFFRLSHLPFGSTKMCLAGRKDDELQSSQGGVLRVATKFTRFTRDYFHNQDTAVEMIKLNGSVELAPVLGLAPYIVDLVETGSTLKANNLAVLQVLQEINVHLIANPAYYKYHYKQVDQFVRILEQEA
ncbi:ATP phosphoribosyltransferase [Spirochaeta lutea]|uniref:ATP phosphoribosyltransferase n=1 Tax=Spirochaeta lutea TaxID=1480694 RepID=A0A098QY95_9SPIO|nr:ATP phosphoribosyltransferase [Spirochaeta lutea]KGE71467.1 ATP phosphoribosyltransferase [Spirochaeta lutea]